MELALGQFPLGSRKGVVAKIASPGSRLPSVSHISLRFGVQVDLIDAENTVAGIVEEIVVSAISV